MYRNQLWGTWQEGGLKNPDNVGVLGKRVLTVGSAIFAATLIAAITVGFLAAAAVITVPVAKIAAGIILLAGLPVLALGVAILIIDQAMKRFGHKNNQNEEKHLVIVVDGVPVNE